MQDSIFKIKEDLKTEIQSGEVSSESPSNIALVKYWGKKGEQIPTNPSISYTLNKCKTQTTVKFSPKKGEQTQVSVYLDGELQPNFSPKILKFIERIKEYCPWITTFDYVVETQNTFPHSSGIASSASGMSALAKCFIQIEKELYPTEEINPHKVSFLSRLGSGSACRSVYSGLVLWGDSEYYPGSSDLYAIPLNKEEIHDTFRNMRDCILLIHEGQKTVSSTIGHNLMNEHPYSETRFSEAKKNIGKLKDILKSGDLSVFGQLIEHEAMSLHALMMMSNPAYILMQEGTLKTIQAVWAFRKETNLPLYFTLDAGANVHLIYSGEKAQEIEQFIKENLIQFTAKGNAIFDSLEF